MVSLPPIILDRMAPSANAHPKASLHLLTLPPEVISEIINHLDPCDLSSIARTCQQLCRESGDDRVWLRQIQRFLPAFDPKADPLKPSLKTIYAAFHPYWFLPQHRIWFSDRSPGGSLVVIRYDHRTQYIETYDVEGRNRSDHIGRPWDQDPVVLIAAFEPWIRVITANPVFQIESKVQRHTTLRNGETRNRIISERVLPVSGQNGSFQSALALCKPLPAAAQGPMTALWPVATIPARQRVRNASSSDFTDGHRPQRLHESSDTTFRLRSWYNGSLATLATLRYQQLSTYSTLDPAVYTPTPLKPWRGIWIGDYSTHGPEFVLVHQPDHGASMTDIPKPWVQSEAGKTGEKIDPWSGMMTAVKLTGDANIPAGQATWSAEDIGAAGLIRVVHQQQDFHGAHMVKGTGQIAHSGFQQRKRSRLQIEALARDPGG